MLMGDSVYSLRGKSYHAIAQIITYRFSGVLNNRWMCTTSPLKLLDLLQKKIYYDHKGKF